MFLIGFKDGFFFDFIADESFLANYLTSGFSVFFTFGVVLDLSLLMTFLRSLPSFLTGDFFSSFAFFSFFSFFSFSTIFLRFYFFLFLWSLSFLAASSTFFFKDAFYSDCVPRESLSSFLSIFWTTLVRLSATSSTSLFSSSASLITSLTVSSS